MRRTNPALLGSVVALLGLSTYLLGVAVAVPRRLLWDTAMSLRINEGLVWYSGALLVLGFTIVLFDLFFLLPHRQRREFVRIDPPQSKEVTVVLTAYNDETSVRAAVDDFKSHPKVRRILVISNNSTDNTVQEAIDAGAIVHNEERQGYGACVYRALDEGCRFQDTELTVLCESDMTFRAYDLDKLLAYIPHADIVNGTRTVEQLRDSHTQLSTFMYYGNLFVGKLLEVKHLGRGTLTDAGTTYKLCRNSALKRLLPELDPSINLEFNAHFLDQALDIGLSLVECPITFHRRVGQSKGGNTNNWTALKVGMRMMIGILSDWRWTVGI